MLFCFYISFVRFAFFFLLSSLSLSTLIDVLDDRFRWHIAIRILCSNFVSIVSLLYYEF